MKKLVEKDRKLVAVDEEPKKQWIYGDYIKFEGDKPSKEDTQIINPHEALKIIKASELYKNYINIGIWVKAIYDNDNRLSKEFIHDLCIEYNKIYGTNYTEYKIKKLIYIKYNKAIKKIESNIGKLCTRYIKDLIIK